MSSSRRSCSSGRSPWVVTIHGIKHERSHTGYAESGWRGRTPPVSLGSLLRWQLGLPSTRWAADAAASRPSTAVTIARALTAPRSDRRDEARRLFASSRRAAPLPRAGAVTFARPEKPRPQVCVASTWGLDAPLQWRAVRLGYRQASELPIELTSGPASGGSRRIPARLEGRTSLRPIEPGIVRLVWRPACQGHTCGGRCGGSRTADQEE